MTVTPINLPSHEMTDTDFDLIQVDSYNQLTSGQGFGTEIGNPYWDANVTVHAMTNLKHGYWDAFFKQCKGVKQSFLMYDANRPTPILHPTANAMTKAVGGAFTGSAAVTSFPTVRSVAVSGLPFPFHIITGDYISFVKSGKYSLHQITSDVDSGAGGLATWTFEPYVNTTYYDSTTLCWVYHPFGEFILKQGTQPNRARSLEAKPLTFEAISRVV